MELQIIQRTFLGKMGPRECFLGKFTCLDNMWLKYRRNIFIYFSLTCSQIWLNPLVDDCQPTYLTNLGGKKKQFNNGTIILKKKNTIVCQISAGKTHFYTLKHVVPRFFFQKKIICKILAKSEPQINSLFANL